LASIPSNRQAYCEQQLALEAARRSICEAKSSKVVMILGIVFIPLAYTSSSLFGMRSPYGPGGESFWVYFSASAPLILVVMTAYCVLNFGYTDDGIGAFDGWELAWLQLCTMQDIYHTTDHGYVIVQPLLGSGLRGGLGYLSA